VTSIKYMMLCFFFVGCFVVVVVVVIFFCYFVGVLWGFIFPDTQNMVGLRMDKESTECGSAFIERI
jgi:hypothetical protein